MAAGCGSGRRCAEAKPRRPDLHRVRGCPPPPAVPTVSTARRQTVTPRNGRYGPPRLLDSNLPGDRGRAGARSTPWRSAEDDGAPRAPSTPTPRRSGGVPRPGSGAARERVPVDRQSRSSRSGAKAAVHGRVPTRPAHGFLDELGARRSLDFRRRGTRRWPCHAAAGFLIPPSCAS